VAQSQRYHDALTFVIAAQSRRNHFVFDRFEIAAPSLCNRRAIALQSTRHPL
jgi:hypothetical protein